MIIQINHVTIILHNSTDKTMFL